MLMLRFYTQACHEFEERNIIDVHEDLRNEACHPGLLPASAGLGNAAPARRNCARLRSADAWCMQQQELVARTLASHSHASCMCALTRSAASTSQSAL